MLLIFNIVSAPDRQKAQWSIPQLHFPPIVYKCLRLWFVMIQFVHITFLVCNLYISN